MTKPAPIRRLVRSSEEGYVLIAVIFLLALLTIALAIALPKISKEIQRDRELETMHRGKQYIRAVKLYYKKFGAYPPNVDALVKPTNNIRFLRKKYADPTTGKEDWKPIRFGQNKAPTVMGFFGVPLGGSTIAGTGPGAGGSGLPGGSSLGQQTPTPDPNAQQAQNPNDPNAATSGTAAPGSTPGSTTGPGAGSTPGSTFGTATGPTFGGGGIIGFSPNSPKQSIMVYKKKDHYNEWEFVYDPIAEQMMQMGGNTGTIGQPASATTTPIGSTPTTTSNPPPATTTSPQL
jgi:type II secretory pathway pseudopilin PulG